MVMYLGDQQLIIALALLVATMKKLYVDKSLSVFHLRLLVNLVFGSSTAFNYKILSWRVMRERGFNGGAPPENYLPPWRNNQDSPRSFWWHLREQLPTVMRIILLSALSGLLWWTGGPISEAYGLDVNCPASCHPDVAKDGDQFEYHDCLADTRWYLFAFIFVILLLVSAVGPYGFVSKIYRYHAKAQCKGSACIVWIWRQLSSASLSLAVVSFYFVTFFVNTLNMWGGRTRSRFAEDIKDEMSLGFGQIVPLFLLIQPLLQFLDSIREHYRENEQQPEGEAASENVTIKNEDWTLTEEKFFYFYFCGSVETHQTHRTNLPLYYITSCLKKSLKF
ncbi:hypothetical protein B0T13DRAFT_225244 [Neurospora crassa]|nr:hypothetical protein B0T13DRAFT_225244 [Neurospora crassa]